MVPELNISQGEFPYQWVITQDQSYTLKSISEDSEWMHSLHGAYSESQYIYGEAVRFALSQKDKPKVFNFLSMGLGLGYVEFITVFECVKSGVVFNIESFELDDKLKDLFKFQCLLGLLVLKNINFTNLDSTIQISKNIKVKEFLNTFKFNFKNENQLCEFYNLSLSVYLDNFFNFFFKDYGFDVIKSGLNLIVEHLNASVESKNNQISNGSEINCSIILNGPMNIELISKNESNNLGLVSQKKFNVIFYDAFSSNTQSELWSEEFLNKFIIQFSDPSFCIFSTYAKVGSLNRSLKSNQFQFIVKKGFANKRESTLALKYNP